MPPPEHPGNVVKVDAVDREGALIDAIEAAQHVEQRAFPTPEAPTIATISPASTCSSRSRSTVNGRPPTG